MKISSNKIAIALLIALSIIGLGLFFSHFDIDIRNKNQHNINPIHSNSTIKSINNTNKLSKPALTVSTVQPQYKILADQLAANGSIGSWQEASVSAEVSGLKLMAIQASIGDTVKKGQILAVFDHATLDADIKAIQAQVNEAQAFNNEAKNNVYRARELAKQGFYSTQAVNQIIAQEKTTLARLEAAKANLIAQQLRLDRTVLRAPDSGIITGRTATIGSVVPAGMELFRINRLGRLEWKAELTHAELPFIKMGHSVTIEDANLPGTAIAKGIVRQIAPNLDPQTRNALVYVDILPNSSLKVGQFVRGYFLGERKNKLTIPENSLVLRDGFNYVFVLKQANDSQDLYKIKQIKIEIGQRYQNFIEVLSGLSIDDKIIATGAAFLSDGDTVKVINP